MDLAKAVLLLFICTSFWAQAQVQGATSLSQAVKQGDLEYVSALLQQGDSPNQAEHGTYPLLLALAENNQLSEAKRAELVELLLEHGAETERPDRAGRTPLMHAAITCRDCVQLLLKAGAEPNHTASNQETALQLAIRQANLKAARFLVQAGASLKTKNSDGEGLLHLALDAGEPEQESIRAEITRWLLDLGLTVDERTEVIERFGHYTPLHFAARNNYQEAANALIQSGANLNAQSAHGVTPLMLAIRNGHTEFVQAFLHHKPDLNKLSDNESAAIHYVVLANKSVGDEQRAEMIELLALAGANLELKNRSQRTALSLAASNDFRLTAQALLKRKAFVNSESADGKTPLFYAVSKGYLEMVKLLLSHRANPDLADGKGNRPLIKAADKNSIEIGEALLLAGTDVNGQNRFGWSALLVAANKGHLEMSRLLVEQGADVNLASHDDWTPLHLVLSKKKEPQAEALAQLVKLLVQAGAALNQSNERGYTPLLMAAVNNHHKAAQVLLDAGADVNFRKDHAMATPILMAVFRGHVEMVRLLLNYSADLSATTGKYNWSPLIAVSGTRDAKNAERAVIAKLLLDAGADPEQTLTGGRNALMNAAEENKLEVVKVLIEAGVNPNSVNDQDGNKTALDYAKAQGHQKVIDYLAPLSL